MVTVEYQTVGERPTTRAVTGVVPSGTMPPLVSSSRADSSFTSPCWVCCRATWSRSVATWSCSLALSPRASKVSWNQLTRSRTGLSARSVTLEIGEKMVETTFSAPCSGPALPSR